MPALEQIQEMLDNSPFIMSSGMKAVAFDDQAQTLKMSMPLLPQHERIADSGQFHGGPIAALIDTAGTFALSLILGHGVPTINFRTDFLRPAINTNLHAAAQVRRAGRTVGVVDIDVVNDEGKLIAVGRGTFGARPG